MNDIVETPQTPDAPPNGEQPTVTLKPPSPENLWTELAIAFNYLTRFNMRLKEEPKPRIIRKAMTWFPLIGAFVGGVGAAVDWVISQLGMPALITSTFAVITMLWITRALHEEEFATLVNQYGVNLDKEQKIGWLREERSVRYGTLGIILIIIMKIGAIQSFTDSESETVFCVLVAASAWSRTLMVVAAAWLRPLAGDPVADHFQQPPALRVVVALILGAGIVFCCLDSITAGALGVGALAGLIVALIGANHLRGYNGPLLGTLQQIVELAVYGMVLAVQ